MSKNFKNDYPMDVIKPYGEIEIIISDGTKSVVRNRILRSGRIALAKALANTFGSSYQYFISSMVFGSGGTLSGTPRYIDDTRTGLFGSAVATKPVIASIDSDVPTKVTFTSVLTYTDAVGYSINEMALMMKSGDYFSMATFGDIAKTSSMQITFNWSISMV